MAVRISANEDTVVDPVQIRNWVGRGKVYAWPNAARIVGMTGDASVRSVERDGSPVPSNRRVKGLLVENSPSLALTADGG
eukprot:7386139-Prymnesium_polylepis.2